MAAAVSARMASAPALQNANAAQNASVNLANRTADARSKRKKSSDVTSEDFLLFKIKCDIIK